MAVNVLMDLRRCGLYTFKVLMFHIVVFLLLLIYFLYHVLSYFIILFIISIVTQLSFHYKEQS